VPGDNTYRKTSEAAFDVKIKTVMDIGTASKVETQARFTFGLILIGL